jgi:hypothetical protein
MHGNLIEIRWLVDFDVGGVSAVQRMAGAYFLPDLKEFFEIAFAASLGVFLTESGITPLPSHARNLVGSLDLGILPKKFLHHLIKGIALLVAESMVSDGYKAYFFVGPSKFLNKGSLTTCISLEEIG